MKQSDHLLENGPQVTEHGRWMKAAFWYSRTPVLKHIDPYWIMVLILGISLAVIFPRGECSCAEQIPDKNLEAKALKGNKEVIAYMQTQDNSILCAARRAELLKELQKQKKPGIRQSNSN